MRKLVSKKASKEGKLFKGENYIRVDNIQGNTVFQAEESADIHSPFVNAKNIQKVSHCNADKNSFLKKQQSRLRLLAYRS